MVAKRYWFGLVAACLLGAGCFDDALRDNPLDPKAEQAGFTSTLQGRIVDRSQSGIAEAIVQATPLQGGASLTTSTAEDGSFELDGLLPATHAISVRHAGYASGADTLDLPAQQTARFDATLNGLPAFETYNAVSVHISRVWPPPTEDYFLDIRATVSDLDGLLDIDRVWLSIPDLNFSDTLMALPAAGDFETRIAAEKLPGGTLQAILGRPLQGWVRDKQGDSVMVAFPPVARLIEEVPAAISPQGGSVVADEQPQFEFSCLELPFLFAYQIDIFRTDEFVPNLIHTEADMDPAIVCVGETGTFTVPFALARGRYFWTIAVIDEFGNRSRSREAGFLR